MGIRFTYALDTCSCKSMGKFCFLWTMDNLVSMPVVLYIYFVHVTVCVLMYRHAYVYEYDCFHVYS